MSIFDSYNNLPEDYIPDNRNKRHKCPCLDIMTGETVKHIFDIPFDIKSECSNVEIIYKLGVEVVIDKVLNADAIVDDNEGHSVITVVLSPEESLKFKDTPLSAHVQLKFMMNDDSITYSEIYPIKVRDALDSNI